MYSKFFKLTIIILTLFLFACQKKVGMTELDLKFDNDNISYSIEYPKIIRKDSVNHIKISNYHSDFDTIKNRIPVVYLMVEDSVVNQNIFKLKNDLIIPYSESYLDDNNKIVLNGDLLKNKLGKKKLTVAIIDLQVKDDLKNENDYKQQESVNIRFLESRSVFDVEVK